MSSSISSSVYVESAMNTVSYCSIRAAPLILACAFAGSVRRRPVEAVHRDRDTLGQGRFRAIGGTLNDLRDHLPLLPRKHAQNELLVRRAGPDRAHADPQTREGLGSQGLDDRPQPVVPSVAAARPQPDSPEFKIQIIADDQQILRPGLRQNEERRDRRTAAVHRAQRSRHQGLLPVDPHAAHQRARLALGVRPVPPPDHLLGDQIPDVVTRRRVLLARVAEAYQDLHLEPLPCGAYFFPSGFLASFFFAASAFLPSSVSSASAGPSSVALPFLITSGSAGAAGAGSPPPAATSSLAGGLTTTSVWSASVSIR